MPYLVGLSRQRPARLWDLSPRAASTQFGLPRKPGLQACRAAAEAGWDRSRRARHRQSMGLAHLRPDLTTTTPATRSYQTMAWGSPAPAQPASLESADWDRFLRLRACFRLNCRCFRSNCRCFRLNCRCFRSNCRLGNYRRSFPRDARSGDRCRHRRPAWASAAWPPAAPAFRRTPCADSTGRWRSSSLSALPASSP